MNTFSLNRVKDCIGSKRDAINVGVDDGKWYDLNLQGVKDSESLQSTSNPQVPPIVVSSATGFVKDASCNCVGSSMGRCSHVAAVLFALLDYAQQFGTDQASCTSGRCEWNVGRKKKKDPKKGD
ncbi:Hypothetical predicted protein [Mytilus galloprovincialis]|uniref:SWIM-type domain-containing protein n=1 Tax=Mytilus galloprovincialis TaxID=29158 RepID=A0A8B6EFL2_MYTGA|nr:Hypothetical predicted protein [Mytilus galloprovincialis]